MVWYTVVSLCANRLVHCSQDHWPEPSHQWSLPIFLPNSKCCSDSDLSIHLQHCLFSGSGVKREPSTCSNPRKPSSNGYWYESENTATSILFLPMWKSRAQGTWLSCLIRHLRVEYRWPPDILEDCLAELDAKHLEPAVEVEDSNLHSPMCPSRLRTNFEERSKS